jgi:uncharacterized protein
MANEQGVPDGGSRAARGIHVLAKPIGPVCDIQCDYCFYLEKRALFDRDEHVPHARRCACGLHRTVRRAQPTPVVEFTWHGGEPTLLGVDFFRRVVELQAPYRDRKEIRNTLQTNAMRLDDEWCAFFKENGFFIGVSIDGPQEIHDRYRKDRHGQGTFERVMAGVRLLQKHGVEFNALACVGRETAYRPLEVYRSSSRPASSTSSSRPSSNACRSTGGGRGPVAGPPARLDQEEPNTQVTPWTVEPEPTGTS